MLIAIDVDGTVADLHTEWIRRYNEDYNDSFEREDWISWDISSLIKKECGDCIFDYLHDKDLYENVMPIPGALEGVNWLRNHGHRIVFVSNCVEGTADQKYFWLAQFGFLPFTRSMTGFVATGESKTIVDADALIDDAIHNLEDWVRYKRKNGVLIRQPWNRLEVVKRNYIRFGVANDWVEVVNYFDENRERSIPNRFQQLELEI